MLGFCDDKEGKDSGSALGCVPEVLLVERLTVAQLHEGGNKSEEQLA